MLKPDNTEFSFGFIQSSSHLPTCTPGLLKFPYILTPPSSWILSLLAHIYDFSTLSLLTHTPGFIKIILTYPHPCFLNIILTYPHPWPLQYYPYLPISHAFSILSLLTHIWPPQYYPYLHTSGLFNIILTYPHLASSILSFTYPHPWPLQ